MTPNTDPRTPPPPPSDQDSAIASAGALALRFSIAPAGTVRAAHRRVAAALLREAAARQTPAGRLVIGPEGDPVLLGAPVAEAGRLAAMLDRLFARTVAPGLAELLPPSGSGARATDAPPAAPAPPLDPPPPGPAGLARLDDLIDALPLAQVLRRQPVLRLRPGAPPAISGVRLAVAPEALAAALGPAIAADPDLAAHAADALAQRLLRHLAAEPAEEQRDGSLDEAALAAPPSPAAAAVPLLLDLPAAMLRGADVLPPVPPFVFVLPLATALGLAAPPVGAGAAPPPPAAADGRAATLALDGLDAETLGLLAPGGAGGERILAGADWLLLRWSPRLAEDRAAAAALRRLDPWRLALLGCDEPAALEWGVARGIGRFGGPWIEAALAAARRLACPLSAGCSLGQCAARAAATDAAERATGCGNPALLAALLPERGLAG